MKRKKFSIIGWSMAGIFGVFFFLLVVQHVQVTYGSDDFLRGSQQIVSLHDVITASWLEYQTWTGRFVAAVTTYFILGGRSWMWIILNPLVMVVLSLSIYYLTKKATSGLLQKFCAILFVIFCFFLLPPVVAREILYWITGSITYLWPTMYGMIFLALWTASFQRRAIGRYALCAALSFAFFAGNSYEQAALVFPVAALWIGIDKWRKGYSWSTLHAVTFVLVCAGSAMLFLAPGNALRLQSEDYYIAEYYGQDILPRLVSRAGELLHLLTESKIHGFLFFLLGTFSALLGVYTWRKSFISYALCALAGISFFMSMNVSIFWWVYIAYFFCIVATVGYACFFISQKDASPIVALCWGMAICSQGVMVVFPYSPYRTFFITFVFLMTAISYVIMRVQAKNVVVIFAIFLGFFMIRGLFTYGCTVQLYAQSKRIVKDNEQIIRQHKETGTREPLVLHRLAHDAYGPDLAYRSLSVWETQVFLRYYGLREDEHIVWMPSASSYTGSLCGQKS